jgi:hypothetical protein
MLLSLMSVLLSTTGKKIKADRYSGSQRPRARPPAAKMSKFSLQAVLNDARTALEFEKAQWKGALGLKAVHKDKPVLHNCVVVVTTPLQDCGRLRTDNAVDETNPGLMSSVFIAFALICATPYNPKFTPKLAVTLAKLLHSTRLSAAAPTHCRID